MFEKERERKDVEREEKERERMDGWMDGVGRWYTCQGQGNLFEETH